MGETPERQEDKVAGALGRLEESAADPPSPSRRRLRFGERFAWGLAAGTLAVVLVMGLAVGIPAYLSFARFSSPSFQPTSVVVSPTTAGRPWFKVADDGTGTLQGWSDGSSGSGNGPGVANFTVAVIDSVDGVVIRHTVDVNVTANTEFLIGGVKYKKGSADSPADAIFNSEDGMGGDILSNALLTIEFHRVDGAIVADRISEPLEGAVNPLMR
jgi:hypothetical protein